MLDRLDLTSLDTFELSFDSILCLTWLLPNFLAIFKSFEACLELMLYILTSWAFWKDF